MNIRLFKIGEDHRQESGAIKAYFKMLCFKWPVQLPFYISTTFDFINKDEKQKHKKWHDFWDCNKSWQGVHEIRDKNVEKNAYWVKCKPYCYGCKKEFELEDIEK